MGLGGISFGSLILIFLIMLLLFGTKRLRHMGEDLGHALRNFKKGLEDPTTAEKSKSDPSDKH